jgi:hypothetical protein
MEYQNLIEDFARRTRDNLRHLQALKSSGAEVYEVTALVNSMLGLLVFPQQRYVNSIPETPIEELSRQGWPIPSVVGNFPQVRNLRQLVRHLRNAISHFNVKFCADGAGQIAGLVVWNVDPRSGRTTWKARLSVSDLDAIAHRFIALILREQQS